MSDALSVLLLLSTGWAAALLAPRPAFSGAPTRRPANPRPPRHRRARAVRALAATLACAAAGLALDAPLWMSLPAAAAAGLLTLRRLRMAPAPAPREMHDLAGFLDLFASCLDAGMPMEAALAACLETGLADGSGAEALGQTCALLALGADAATAWQPVRQSGPLGTIAAAARRSTLGGVRLADAARETAGEIRATCRGIAERRAARAGVIMTAPLTLCFLPAFVCLGLAPTVMGLVASLNLW